MIKKKTFLCFISFAIALSSLIFMTTSTDDNVLINKAKMKQAIKQSRSEASSVEIKIKEQNLMLVSLIGAVAISAMILPGISGSFLLLLMGAYFPLLKALSTFDVVYLAFFGMGIVFGLLLFSRLLNYLLKIAHDITLSALTGLVIGSLFVIWPFKNTALVGEKIIYLSNKMPASVTSAEISVLLSAILGSIIVLIMIKTENKAA